MPFTPSHAAIVLPFFNIKRLSATALVVGSMAPDFEYFFKFNVESYVSHTWWGILYFNLPVVLLLSWVFHTHVKQNLINNLPPFLQKKFQDTLAFDFKAYIKTNWFWFFISGGIGAASHLFWDSFTHAHGFFARELPFYKGTFLPFNGVRYPLFYVLQHTSTMVGLVVLTIHVFLKRSAFPFNPTQPTLRYWFILAVFVVVATTIRFAIYSADYNIGNLVVSSISGLCIGLIILGWFPFTDKPSANGQKISMGTNR